MLIDIFSLRYFPRLRATAVAVAALMLVMTLVDVAIADVNIIRAFLSSELFQTIQLCVAWLLGGFMVRSTRIDTEKDLTIGSLYIFGLGMVLIAGALIAVALLI